MGEQVAAGFNGGIAQLGEHLPCKQGVESSNLSVSTGLKANLLTIRTGFCISKTRKGNASHFDCTLKTEH